jgi:phosphatidylglycerol:prolipoprotein diacylglycerol transferase
MGIAVLFFLTKKRNIKLLKALDYLAPLTAFAQSVGRWGNFVNQEAFGQIVSENYYNFFPEFIKKQMFINGSYREATFLYESTANFLLFIFLIFYLHSSQKKNGEIFSFYLIFYSLFRFFIEEQRTDSLLIAGEIQVAKLISVFMIIAGFSLLYYVRKVKESAE